MRKLAIVGSGSQTRENAPFGDPVFDIWVLNEAANAPWCKRWTACFQMHEPEIYAGHNTKDALHWQWLQKQHGKPIYMQEVDTRVPDSVQYPLAQAVDLAGMTYLSSTIALACALSILMSYEQVHFWGVELSVTEYQSQADCIRFWVGFLKGRLGAENVVLHSGEHLFAAPLYGYDGNYAFGGDYFAMRAAKLDNQWRAADKHAKNMRKAVERAIGDRDYSKVPDLVRSYQESVSACGEIAGALAESERYQGFGDRYADRGGFEFAAASAQRDGEAKRILLYMQLGKVEYIWNAWVQSKTDNAGKQLVQAINSLGQIAQETGAMLGMYRENLEYILKYDAVAQAGGRVLLEMPA